LNDEKKDISLVLHETSFKKERIKLYSTLPVVCQSPEDNCKLDFFLGVMENNEDLFRVSDCGNKTSGNLRLLTYIISSTQNESAIFNQRNNQGLLSKLDK